MTPRETTGSARLVHRWFEDLFTEGDLSVADEILADDVDYRGPGTLSPATVDGPSDVKEFVEVYRTAFPDLEYTVDAVAGAGEQFVVQWSAVGTHENAVFGVEPTGESFVVEGISVFVTDDGAITDVRAQWDTLKMVQELGSVSSDLGLE
ncbi:hypothetical protein BRC92_09200 [Halobacteriales archaeon QS_4_69_31]|nr:MAG: hypothetical protein BRC92_09200 [Halobacteriales archaeon QS_4_69_31]